MSLPWRVGTKVPRNLYDADGRDIGRMDDAADAKMVVAAVNATDGVMRCSFCGRPRSEAKVLVAGACVSICGVCVDLAVGVIAAKGGGE